MMGCNLSQSELRYGGGPLSPDERELLGPIEWLTQLRGLDKCWKKKPEYVVKAPGQKGRNAGATFQAQQGELKRSEIIDYLMRTERAKTIEIARDLEVTDTTIRTHLMILMGKGIVRRLDNFEWELV